MRVTISHKEEEETTGFFSKSTTAYWVVTCHVIFSEEERHILEKMDTKNILVLQRTPTFQTKYEKEKPELFTPTFYNLKLSSLLHGPNEFKCGSPSDAKQYEEKLWDVMPKIKSYLEVDPELDGEVNTREF